MRHYIILIFSCFLISNICAQDIITIDQGGTVTTCNGLFYDSGGSSGNYSNDESYTITICPDGSGRLQAEFTEYSTESDYDGLVIYDGSSTSDPTLAALDNSNLPAGIYAATFGNSTGCLTFRFISDGSLNYEGWAATISCAYSCQDIVASLDTANMSPVPDDSARIDICPGQSVDFAGTGIYENNGDYPQRDGTSEFIWRFGDGTIDTAQTISHTYNDPGVYYVELVVVDSSGCASQNAISLPVRVSSRPIFSGTTGPTDSVCLDEVFSLNGSVTGREIKVEPPLPVTETVHLPQGSGECYAPTIDYTGVFPPGATLQNASDIVRIFANMEHSWIGDLHISIECPTGQRIWLHNLAQIFQSDASYDLGEIAGGLPSITGASNPGTGYEYSWPSSGATYGSFLNSSADVIQVNSNSTLPAGSYTSEESFDGLVGCDLNGVWTMHICDLADSDDGFVFEFGLNFNPSLYATASLYTPTIDSVWWSESGSTIQSQTGLNAQAAVSTETTTGYTFNAQDNAGCIWDTTVNVITKDCDGCIPPSVFNGVYPECDNGDGTATYDLTIQEAGMAPLDPGINVVWFTDAALTDTISNPDAYISLADTVYGEFGDSNCTNTGFLALTVGNAPAFDQIMNLCDDGGGSATFNLTAINGDITGGAGGATVAWFSDSLVTAIGTPTAYSSSGDTVYAQVTDGGGCQSTAWVILTVGDIIANDTSMTACSDEDGNALFDLNSIVSGVNNGAGYQFLWFEDSTLTNSIDTPDVFVITQDDTVYVEVSDGSACSAVAQVILTVNIPPQVFNGVYPECDAGDGTAVFDLTIQEASLSPLSIGEPFTWYEDAALTIEILQPDSFVSTSTVCYAVVGTGCYSVAQLQLTVSNLNATSTALSGCDEGGNQATFDLTDANATIDGGLGYTINYFTDTNLTIPVADEANYISGPDTVYAQVISGSCSSNVEVALTVGAPTAQNATISACGTTVGTFDLTSADSAILMGGTNNITYFSDSNRLNEISTDPTAFTSSAGIVYVTVGTAPCIAEAEITLTLAGGGNASDATMTLPEISSGTAIFDLTTLNTTVNNGQGGTVEYYLDDQYLNQINPADAYQSVTDTLYALLIGTNGCQDSSLVFINVILDTSAQILNPDSTSMIVCANDTGVAVFDLTKIENTINRGTGNIVNWFSDLNLTINIPNPSSYASASKTIYATVNTFNGIGVVDLYAINGGLIGQTTAITLCDEGNGAATFNLNNLEEEVIRGSEASIAWYSDEDATVLITNTSAYVTSTAAVYALVTAGDSCSGVVPVNLWVGEFEANDAALSMCGDNQGNFDLTAAAAEIGWRQGFTIEYFTNEAATDTIEDPLNYISNGGIVYARLSSGTGCSDIAKIVLSVGDLTANATAMRACDALTGTGTFDLTLTEEAITGGAEYNVDWFSDNQLTQPIGTPDAYVSSTAEVWAVVSAGDSCLEITRVLLSVSSIAPQDTILSICADNLTEVFFDLTSLDSTLNQGTYLPVTWYQRPSRINEIFNPGLYSPSNLQDGQTIVYAEVCNATAAVTLSVFERDSFNISSEFDEYRIQPGDSIELNTNAPGFVFDWSPGATLSDSTAENVFASPLVTTTYTLTISNQFGCSVSDTVVVYVDTTQEGFKNIGEIFTPNGDGINDEIFIQGPGICEIELQIFNRWGVLVFQTSDVDQGWNGGIDNDPSRIVEGGDYRYALRYKLCGKEEFEEELETGVITIVR